MAVGLITWLLNLKVSQNIWTNFLLNIKSENGVKKRQGYSLPCSNKEDMH